MMAERYYQRTGNPEVDRLVDGFGEFIGEFEQMRGQLTEVRGHGEAMDGLVKVEVAPGGVLLSVDIEPKAMRLGSKALGAAIVEASAIAVQQAATRMNDLLSPLLGEVDGFNEALQGKLPSLDLASSFSSSPELAEALRVLQEIRAKYDD
jgi:DNA-binding protein YbaB